MTIATEFAHRMDLMGKIAQSLPTQESTPTKLQPALTAVQAISRTLNRDKLIRFFTAPGSSETKEQAKPFARLFKSLRDIAMYIPTRFLSNEQQEIQKKLKRADEALPQESLQKLFENPEETINVTGSGEIAALGLDNELTNMLHNLMAITATETGFEASETQKKMLQRYEELIDCISANDQIFHFELYGMLAYYLTTGEILGGAPEKEIQNPEIFRNTLDKIVKGSTIEKEELDCLKSNIFYFIHLSMINPENGQPIPKDKRDLLIKNIIKAYNNLQGGV